jgi:ferrous iron transport protein B
MLFQALGTHDVSSVMSLAQIFVFTIFTLYYIPCIATIGVLLKQVRVKATLAIVVFTFILALFMGVLSRGVAAIFW